MSIGTIRAAEAELEMNVDNSQQSRPAPMRTMNTGNSLNGMLCTMAFARPDSFMPVPRAKPPATIHSNDQSIVFMSSELMMPNAEKAPTGNRATT